MHYFHFAVPTKGGTRHQRENVLGHIAKTFGVVGTVRFVRAEPNFRLYVIEHKAAS